MPIRLAKEADGRSTWPRLIAIIRFSTKFKPLGDATWQDYPVYHYWKLAELPEGVTPISTNGWPASARRADARSWPVACHRPRLISDPPTRSRNPGADCFRACASWPFFIMTNEIALYLIGSSDSELNYLVRPSGPPASPTGRTCRQLSALNAQERPDSWHRRRPQGFDHRTATGLPGHYRSAQAASGIDRGFSVNLSTDATSLERAQPSELNSRLRQARVSPRP